MASLPSVQLVDSNGCFNAADLDRFIHTTEFANCGVSYSFVAVIGAQSSGKSTLLNHLFGTKFMEMDASEGRSRTTQGIWIEKCADIEPVTIAMDVEGADGSERGEDNTIFERQSALFALAVADVVLINIWCHDIGREHAANKPLLKMVFQVMLRLFGPRKTTLLFVIRDKTKTPLEKLDPILRQEIQKIWDAVPKPEPHKITPLSEFFNVEVTALSSYEEKEQQFKEQVAELRQRFFPSISPGRLARDRQGVVPASGFSVMVATVRCDCLFVDEGGWLALEEAIKDGPVAFTERLNTFFDTYLSKYDDETIYFDEDVRTRKRQYLESKALEEARKRVPIWPSPTPDLAPPLEPNGLILPVTLSVVTSVAGVVGNILG